jgi:queuine tRNA-ribosyltransferase
MNIKNARFAEDPQPVDLTCDCYTCQTFSRAYLRHLFKAGEITSLRLCTIHNVAFMQRLMQEIRTAIATSTFASYREEFLTEYQVANQNVRHQQRARRSASYHENGPAAT